MWYLIPQSELTSQHQLPIASEMIKAGDLVSLMVDQNGNVRAQLFNPEGGNTVPEAVAIRDATEGKPVTLVSRYSLNTQGIIVLGKTVTTKPEG